MRTAESFAGLVQGYAEGNADVALGQGYLGEIMLVAAVSDRENIGVVRVTRKAEVSEDQQSEADYHIIRQYKNASGRHAHFYNVISDPNDKSYDPYELTLQLQLERDVLTIPLFGSDAAPALGTVALNPSITPGEDFAGLSKVERLASSAA